MKGMVWVLFAASLTVLACSENTPGVGSCLSDADCPGGQHCQAGVCYADCSVSSDCPGGQVCVSGFCRTECGSDTDCGDLE